MCVCVCVYIYIYIYIYIYMIVRGFHLHPTAWQECEFCWPKTLMYVDERGWPLSHSQVWSSNEHGSTRWRGRYAFAPDYIALLSLAIKRHACGHWTSACTVAVTCLVSALPHFLWFYPLCLTRLCRIKAICVDVCVAMHTGFFLSSFLLSFFLHFVQVWGSVWGIKFHVFETSAVYGLSIWTVFPQEKSPCFFHGD